MSPRQPRLTHVLFDLDGVLRHYDPGHAAAVEASWGLAPGSLAAAAFEPGLLQRLVTGRLSRRAWIEEVGVRVGSPGAAQAWGAEPGRVDPDVLALVQQLRRRGVVVAVLSNGSDELGWELDRLGLAGHLDVVINSADIGYAKPDHAAYAEACRRLGVDRQAVLFVDDTLGNVEAARSFGLAGHHFTGVAELRRALAQRGVDLDPAASTGTTGPVPDV